MKVILVTLLQKVMPHVVMVTSLVIESDHGNGSNTGAFRLVAIARGRNKSCYSSLYMDANSE